MSEMNTQPNILWIMADQHAAHALRCYGNSDIHTPNLDALATDGVLFSQAYCNNPICAPSRACFYTGQYVHTHGITGNNVYDYNETSPPNVAEHFRHHGYQTAIVGKAHLPKNWIDSGFEHQRLADLADAAPDDPLSIDYFAYLTKEGLANNYDLGTLYPPHPGASMSGFISALPFEQSTEHWTGNESLHFLQHHRDAQRPFFLKMSFQRPHDPYAPSAEQADLYDPASLAIPRSAAEFFDRKFEGKPEYQKKYIEQESAKGYPYRPSDPDDLRQQLAYYYTLVTVIDNEIGRVIDYLKATGEYENTIITYHADHGDFAGQHGLMLKNLGTYESIHRIPWILRYPRGPKGHICDELVESVDLFPTLCESAGLPIPELLDGCSLLPVSEGDASGKEQVCSEWDFPASGMKSVFSIRTRTHRLVFYPELTTDGELYDHRVDPEEIHNRYKDDGYTRERLSLTEKLLKHVSRFKRNLNFDRGTSPNGPTAQIHKLGHRWSDVAPLCETKP